MVGRPGISNGSISQIALNGKQGVYTVCGNPMIGGKELTVGSLDLSERETRRVNRTGSNNTRYVQFVFTL